ncbi:hypothetical protein Vretimale_16454 [Volvox reticuliferus]|uniref:UTP25 NTP hydrolase-like domain-containing protein n=1 Tax=Volvox reticuliferus TaxID=1737510 RepID=A0A8J4LWT0_9CHLO|nr:hypothetical protein Vretifemale_8657 [Volvox reticuliferus]GIM13320.1 hypothetical protein Vretimale_16454 [Volvox reticuliferus]
MLGSKLARLLQGVGGAARDNPTGQSAANSARPSQAAGVNGIKPKAGQANGNTATRDLTRGESSLPADPAARRSRKRRRGKASQQTNSVKRLRHEAGPAVKKPAESATAAQKLTEEMELLAEERQKLLGDRSAYEVLMDELARSRRGGGGSTSSSKANLRAHLQLLRSEQRGESSEGEEPEEEESSGGEEPQDLLRRVTAKGSGAERVDATERIMDSDDNDGTDDEGGDDDEEEDEDYDGDDRSEGQGGGHKERKGLGRDGSEDVSDSSTHDHENGHSLSSSGLEEEEEEDGDGTAAPGVSRSRAAAGGGIAGKTAAPLVVDTWTRHVGRELTDAEVALLAVAGKCGYLDAPSADEVHLTAWGSNAKWQMRMYGTSGACGKARKGSQPGGTDAAAKGSAEAATVFMGLKELPPAPNTLPEYGVKERLVSRWREVRQEDKARTAAAAAAAVVGHSSGAVSASDAPSGKRALDEGDFCSQQQRSWFALLNSYVDVHLPGRPYPTDASLDAPDPLLDAVLLHCLNHVAKTADRIKKNTHTLQLQQQQQQQLLERQRVLQQKQQQKRKHKQKKRSGQGQQQAQEEDADDRSEQRDREVELSPDAEEVEREQVDEEPQRRAVGGQHQHHDKPDAPEGNGTVPLCGTGVGAPRDQGFTRPKVLVLLPQRNCAFRAVRRLVALAVRETRSDSVQGKERFVEQFTDPEEGEQAEEKLGWASR